MFKKFCILSVFLYLIMLTVMMAESTIIFYGLPDCSKCKMLRNQLEYDSIKYIFKI